MRIDVRTLEELERRSAQRGESKSRLAQRYIEEAMRMEAFPAIQFRDGPTGRRAAIIGDMDVWQFIGCFVDPLAPTREELEYVASATGYSMPLWKARSALDYYAAHTAEVDEWVRRNEEAGERFLAENPHLAG
jgi:hypothetical protein